MGKGNGTAASKAHTPESAGPAVHASAYSYPGKKAPKGEKVMDASHDQAALDCGRKASMGVSADGSHKGLPSEHSTSIGK